MVSSTTVLTPVWRSCGYTTSSYGEWAILMKWVNECDSSWVHKLLYWTISIIINMDTSIFLCCSQASDIEGSLFLCNVFRSNDDHDELFLMMQKYSPSKHNGNSTNIYLLCRRRLKINFCMHGLVYTPISFHIVLPRAIVLDQYIIHRLPPLVNSIYYNWEII